MPSRGPTEAGKRSVRWVYSVTGKEVLVLDGPDGYPRFALTEPRRPQPSIETQAPVENLVV